MCKTVSPTFTAATFECIKYFISDSLKIGTICNGTYLISFIDTRVDWVFFKFYLQRVLTNILVLSPKMCLTLL